MGPASWKQGDVARAQYARLGPRDLNLNHAPLHEMDSAHVVALHPSRRRVRGGFRDVVPGEVNRAQQRRENIPGRCGIRTVCI
jgi:hypothetical protein